MSEQQHSLSPPFPPFHESGSSAEKSHSSSSFGQHFSTTAADDGDCSSHWMEALWGPPVMISATATTHNNQYVSDFSPPDYEPNSYIKEGVDYAASEHFGPSPFGQFELPHKLLVARPGPIGKGEEQREMRKSEHCHLVVLKQPEEQHRARYASEGSRGAIKDRSGTSYCTIQLIGYHRPTRLQLFAAQRSEGGHKFVEHSLYKLVPVAGKSSTITPCQKVVEGEEGKELLEVTLRPESCMIAVLDCVGIMKMCSYATGESGKKALSKRKRKAPKEGAAEAEAEQGSDWSPNEVHIVARALLPDGTSLQVETEAIRCVQQLGSPEVLKMSLQSCQASGGQELFIIGRNFNAKNTRVLFREYNNDGLLGWSAEAKLNARFLHQCHIVCTVPAYQFPYRGALVSVTVVCGPKQSHPINFVYVACERDDDDWRPPDCSNTSSSQMMVPRHSIGDAHSAHSSSHSFHHHQFYASLTEKDDEDDLRGYR